MAKRITTERMLKAGLLLANCEDGKFWVMERQAGEEADRLVKICRMVLEDVDVETVTEDFVLQCDSDFKNPVLYIDGYLWQLTNSVFSDIITRITRLKKN